VASTRMPEVKVRIWKSGESPYAQYRAVFFQSWLGDKSITLHARADDPVGQILTMRSLQLLEKEFLGHVPQANVSPSVDY